MNYDDIKTCKKLYSQNKNIIKYCNSRLNTIQNSSDAIQYSYDLQAGSYYQMLKNSNWAQLKIDFAKIVSDELSKFPIKTVLEAGVGEASTLGVLALKNNTHKFFGFDISLSRLLFAQKYLKEVKRKTKLFCADFENIPLPDNSIDAVYTMGALEPNHGREKIMINELSRVTKKFLILVEPSYELGNKITRKHIEEHGYVRGLTNFVKKSGFEILKYELLKKSFRKNNQMAIIVARKKNQIRNNSSTYYVSPISKTKLAQRKNYLYCKEDSHVFPIIESIPCLLKNNGIVASKISDF